MERRKSDTKSKFIAPLVAAAIGSSPATYVSFEMYQKLSERSLVNQTQLIEYLKWRDRQEIKFDEIDRSITQIRVDVASLKHSKG